MITHQKYKAEANHSIKHRIKSRNLQRNQKRIGYQNPWTANWPRLNTVGERAHLNCSQRSNSPGRKQPWTCRNHCWTNKVPRNDGGNRLCQSSPPRYLPSRPCSKCGSRNMCNGRSSACREKGWQLKTWCVVEDNFELLHFSIKS